MTVRPRADRPSGATRAGLLALTLLAVAGASTPLRAADPRAAAPRSAAPLASLEHLQSEVLRGVAGRPSTEARVAARSAALLEIGALDAPRVELQTEARGAGGAVAATDKLRFVQPFHWPGDGRRELARSIDGWSDAERRAELLGLVVEATRSWLELAADADRIAIAESRIERLDRALELWRLRLELGEVAGTEVRQLELQRSADLADLEMRRAHRRGLEAELRVLAEVESPVAGDLARLLDALGAAVAGDAPSDVAGPFVDRLAAFDELAQRRRRVELATSSGAPEASFEWQRLPTGGLSRDDTWGLQLSVPLPFGSARRSRRARARAEAELARLETRVGRSTLDATLDRLVADERSAGALIEQLEPLFAERDRAERSLSEQFRLGAITYLAYLDGFARLDQLRERRVDALLQLTTARLERAAITADARTFPLPTELLAVSGPSSDGSDRQENLR